MSLKPYLQLIRLPNLFTAAADSLTGWLLIRGGLEEPRRWLCLVGASVMLYAGGVALNDIRDYAIDLRERPRRPLPSGQVPLRIAYILTLGLLAIGLGLGIASGTRWGGAITMAVLLAVLGYDLGLKSTPIGPISMGLCRSLNLLLGLSVSENLGGPAGWTLAFAYGAFVAGITWISRTESDLIPTRDPSILGGWMLQNVAVLCQTLAVYLVVGAATNPESQQVAAGLVILGLIGIQLNRKGYQAWTSPSGRTIQSAVRSGIFSLVWLHVGVLLASRGVVPAASVAWLWFPAIVIGRWLYAT